MLVLEFERGIQAYDPSVAAHFWDWSRDAAHENIESVFSARYYGENSGSPSDGYALVNGAFYNWTVSTVADARLPAVLSAPFKGLAAHCLLRGASSNCRGVRTCKRQQAGSSNSPECVIGNPFPKLGRNPMMKFMIDSGVHLAPHGEVLRCLEKSSFRQLWMCTFYAPQANGEGPGQRESMIHGNVHALAGGLIYDDGDGYTHGVVLDMMDLYSSPNDPIFFAHHSQIERIFQAWALETGSQRATEEDPCGGYDDCGPDPCPPGTDLHGPIAPLVNIFGTQGGESSFSACKNLYNGKAPYRYSVSPFARR